MTIKSITIKLDENLLHKFNKKIGTLNKNPLNRMNTKSSILREAIINFIKSE